MRLGSTIMLVVLLSNMLAFVNVKLVKATGTIYIKADGSVDPPDAPIQRAGNIYTLKGNITTDADGIVIERDNMTLDGGGYTLQGAPGWPYQNGTRILKSINVTIQNMRIENFANGIVLDNSSHCMILDNVLISNGAGVWLAYSSNNTIQENQIAWSNYHGLVAFSSSRNLIVRNSFAKDWYGVWLESSSNNWIYHNHFIDNTNQLFTRGSVNVWDNGYPSGGNHWSNYNGTDRYGGQYQNLTGSDGIGDIPYAIDANNNDRYPLRTHDVATTSVKPSKSIVGQGDPVFICVTAENHGYSSESFNVTVYADSIVIAFAGVTLAEGKSTIITFIWNTTDSARDDYIISAVADAVPGETQIGDNHLTGDEIRVGISGDVNGDGLVDLKDVYTVGRAFGSARNETDGSYWHTPRHSCCPHSPNCDINDDGKVDLKDYYTTCKNYGKSW